MGKIFKALEKAKKENFSFNEEFEDPICSEKEEPSKHIIYTTNLPKSEISPSYYDKKKNPILKEKKNIGKKLQNISSKLTLPDNNIITGEVYRSLRNSILRITSEKLYKSLIIISPNHGEGKTSTAINLAIAITDIKEYRILLVESDLRYPDIHKRLELEQSTGLVDILKGTIDLKAGIKDTYKENLKVITSGILHSHPAELLESKKLKDFINNAKTMFDLILFDSPPFLLYSDANIIRFEIDCILLVVEAEKTNRESLKKVEAKLQNEHGEILGIVFNKYHSKPFRKRK